MTLRGNKIAMIFQEPMTSLNPYLKIGTQLIEPLCVHLKMSKREAWKRAAEALEHVGIARAESAMDSYPHEFSGGMRQRVMIAMALTTRPECLIADEPTTALDVTVQAQILDLLRQIQKETGMALVLITHDLGVVAGLADRVLVMYAGKVFEEGTAEEVFSRSQHPYTQALLRSTPRIDIPQDVLPIIGGAPPDLSRLGTGCPFYDRCGYRVDACQETFPTCQDLRHRPPIVLSSEGDTGMIANENDAELRPHRANSGSESSLPRAVRFSSRRAQADFKSGRWRVARSCQGRDSGPGRRVGMRKEHARPRHSQTHPGDLRAK